MKSTIESRTLESTISGGILFLINFLQAIVLVPLILEYWGKEKYGVWLSIFSFISLIKTIEIGHQNYVGNEFIKAFYINKNNAYKILSSAYYVCILLGAIEVLVFAIFYFKFTNFIFGESSKNLLDDKALSFALFIFILIWSLFGSVGGLLVRIIIPLGLYATTTKLSIINKLSELIILFCSVFFKWKLAVLFWGFAFVNFSFSCFVFIYIKKMAPEFYPWWKIIDWRIGVRNFVKSTILTINAFVEQFNSSGILLIITSTLSVATVPIFTTIRTATNVVLQITSLMTNPLLPEIIRFQSNKEFNKILNVFETNLFLSGLLVNLPFLLVSPFIDLLYTIWVKNSLLFNPQLYYLLTLSVCFVNFGRSYLTYLFGINSIKSIIIITISRFALTIGLSFLLMPFYKLIAIGVAILIAEFFSSFLLPILLVNYEHDKLLKLKFNLFQISGLFQVIVLSLFYFSLDYNSSWSNVIFGFSVFLMIGISYFQWFKLDYEVRLRFKNLLSGILQKK